MQNTFHIPDYSPILQRLSHPLFTQQNLNVEILRADLLHPVISGNKWMKLQPWLRRAKAEGLRNMVTKGGPWSNHVHAAAYACQQEGLAFTAIIKAKEGMLTGTLEDVRKWGGQIFYTQNEAYKDENHWQQFANERNALYIPMGGEGAEGILGVTEFFNSLKLPAYQYVICPVGTGTTFMGVAKSSLRYQNLIGTDPGIYDANYASIVNQLQVAFPQKSFAIKQDKLLGKFGKWPAFLPHKMNSWLADWQLPTDIVYTAKMLCQFEQWIADCFFEKNSDILLLHTGGLQGNRSVPAGLLKN